MNKLLIFPFVLLLFSACHDSRRYPAELVQADSAYMRGDYPLADSLLAAYDAHPSQDANKAVAMYHQLLKMEQLFVQSAITEKHFSIIDSLCRYYARNDSQEKYAKALMFQGESYTSVGDLPTALDYYMSASEIAKVADARTLLGLIYKLQGKVYVTQRMFEDGAAFHRKALAIAQSCNDTLRIIHASMFMGLIYTAENKIDSTLEIYHHVHHLIQSFPKAQFIMPVLNWRIGDIYIQTHEFEKALPYMPREPFYISNWAYWHYGQNHIDSAIYYFEKGYEQSTLLGKAEDLRILMQLERKKNNYIKAIDYAEQLIIIEDSIKKVSQADDLRKVESLHKQNVVKRERDEIERKRQNTLLMLWLSFAFFILCCLAAYYAWLNYKHKKEEELLQERRLRQLEADNLRQSKEQIERNKKEIASLKNQLDEARRMNDIEFIHRLELETEKLEAENKNIEILQKHRELKEKQLFAAPLCQHVMKHAGQDDFHLTEDQWQELAMLIDDAYDHFTDRLLGLSRLSENELRVCYLIKLGVASAHIATMMFKSKSAVTMMRQRMCRKILKKEGTATQLNEFICSL